MEVGGSGGHRAQTIAVNEEALVPKPTSFCTLQTGVNPGNVF